MYKIQIFQKHQTRAPHRLHPAPCLSFELPPMHLIEIAAAVTACAQARCSVTITAHCQSAMTYHPGDIEAQPLHTGSHKAGTTHKQP